MALVIGIGGTGARCVEALLYFVSAGVWTPQDEIKVLLVDQHVERNKTVENVASQISLWDAYSGRPGSRRLGAALGSEKLRWFSGESRALGDEQQAGDPLTRDVLQALFLDEDTTMVPNGGYRQRAHLGALHQFLYQDDALVELFNRNDPAFVFGSVFGGMGASGIPAIGARLTDERRRGLAALGAYFKIPERPGAVAGPNPDRQQSMLSTAAAWAYYSNRLIYDTTYWISPRRLAETSTAWDPEGSVAGQDNKPHLAELLAATACMHFLSNPGATGVQLAVASELGWKGLPDGEGISEHLAAHRLAAAFVAEWIPKCREDAAGLSWGERCTDEQFEQLMNMRPYCERFVSWHEKLMPLPSTGAAPPALTVGPTERQLAQLYSGMDRRTTGDEKANLFDLVQSVANRVLGIDVTRGSHRD